MKLWKKIKSLFEKKYDIQFVDTTLVTYPHNPVIKAAACRPKTQTPQIQEYGKHLLPGCPGILELAQYGYIIPAWTDIHIKANKAGVVYNVGGKRVQGTYAAGRLMDHKFLTGLLEFEDGVNPQALCFDSPWSIHAKRGVSAWVGPAIYHSTFLDDLWVVPGIVDYHRFHTVNFILTPRRECEVTILAGEPLLHVMPFYHKDMKASVGPGTDYQRHRAPAPMFTNVHNFYRKAYRQKKTFEIELENKD